MKKSISASSIDIDKTLTAWNSLGYESKYSVIAEIDRYQLINNIKMLKKLLNKETKIMAIVKANAYGHGAVQVSKKIAGLIDYLGVSRISEAIDLRKNKINSPILILGATDSNFAEILCQANITQAIHSTEMAKLFSDNAIKIGKKLKVHIKIDTGLGRFGLFLHKVKTKKKLQESIEKVTEEIKQILAFDGLDVEGIYTHSAATNLKNINGLKKQVTLFNTLVEHLKHHKINFKFVHAISSFGLFNIPNAQFNMVRLGKAIYGITPISNKDTGLILQGVMKIKTKISTIKTVPKGTKIGYGYNYVTSKETRVATIPFGFADGCIWEPKQTSMSVLIKSQRVPIIGRICMDFIMLDVSSLDDIQIGDEVILVGKSGEEEIRFEDIAVETRTIPTYVSTSLGSKTIKIYTN